MNIRITTFSLLVAATCGLAFNQAAKADEEDVKHLPSMRFDFGGNQYALDHVAPRHHYVSTFTPSSVHSGAAPKNLLGLDPSFVSKPAPLPKALPPAPAPQATVAAKPILPSAFSSLFGHPTAPLVAQGPGALPPVAAGIPAAPAKALGHHPSVHVSTNGTAKLIHAARPTGMSARPVPSIASYAPNQGYQAGSVLPGYSNAGGMTASSAVSGSVIGHRR